MRADLGAAKPREVAFRLIGAGVFILERHRMVDALESEPRVYAIRAWRLEATGIHETARNINNKISRGGFTAVFFLQCLVAIGCTVLRLEDGF